MHNIYAYQLPQNYQIQKVLFTALTVSVMWYMCCKLACNEILQNFFDSPLYVESQTNLFKIHLGEPILLELIELAKESINSLHNQTDSCQYLVNPTIQLKNPLQSEEIQSCPHPVSTEKKQVNCSSASQKELWITLIQLDHMRSKSKYTKIIKNWCKNFNLSGRLIFCQKLILILLFGDHENLKVIRLNLIIETFFIGILK